MTVGKKPFLVLVDVERLCVFSLRGVIRASPSCFVTVTWSTAQHSKIVAEKKLHDKSHTFVSEWLEFRRVFEVRFHSRRYRGLSEHHRLHQVVTSSVLVRGLVGVTLTNVCREPKESAVR